MIDRDQECPHLPRVPGIRWRAVLCKQCCAEDDERESRERLQEAVKQWVALNGVPYPK